MTSTDARGNPVSAASDAASETFEAALVQFQTYSGDPFATIEGALEAQPDFTMGHLLRAALMLTAVEKGLQDEVGKSLNAAAAGPVNEREAMHLAAAKAWHAGDFEVASRGYLDLSVAYPRDIVALQVGHLCDFYMGNAGLLRDRIAAALPSWSPEVPGYHAMLGMHAFGREECGDYRRAEDAGRAAVALNKRDAWAIHAVAHVLEMEGRTGDGIDWMTARTDDWAVDNFFAVHNWWRLALYHLDRGDVASVLKHYDEHVRGEPSEVILDMVDASAMLWRLNLLGADVGDRWTELAETWAPLAGDGFYAFNDAHAMMAFVGAGRDDLQKAALDALEAAARRNGGSNAAMSRDVGLPIARALHAFGKGAYGEAVENLRDIRYRAHRFGGSNAQRDLLHWTLVEAALRDSQFELARALINERTAMKPTSLQNWEMAARAGAGLGDGAASALARERIAGIRGEAA